MRPSFTLNQFHTKYITLSSGARKWAIGSSVLGENSENFDFYDYAGIVGVRMMIQSSTGNVGIGTTNPGSYKLYVNGPLWYGSGGLQGSDLRLKKNLAPINDSLNKVLNLAGVSYEWKRDEYKDKNFPEGRHYGVIAQEIEKVLPEVVSEGPDGMKGVAYAEIIPVLIEAIKEQQKEIEQLKKMIAEKK